jgi:putative RecB family exonuclease
MYLQCSKQYEFRYMEGLRSPPGIALVEGSGHHEALAFNNKRKMKTGKDVKPKTQFEKFMAYFEKSKAAVEDWGGDTEDGVVQRAKKIVEVYHADYAPLIKPKACETRYTLEIGGVKFLAIVDVEMNTENGRAVRDYKVKKRRSSANEVEANLQLTLYSIATESMDVGLVELLKLKNPAVNEVTSKRSLAQKRHAVRIVKGVVAGIRKGVFMRCNPEEWMCNERFCGYYHKCHKTRVKPGARGVSLKDLKKKAKKRG